jgi:hypothetical protein
MTKSRDGKDAGVLEACGRKKTPLQCRKILRGAAGVLFLWGMLLPSALAAASVGESDVKAAFILNFIKFVEWPSSAFSSPEDPILISVVGNDPMGDSIDGLGGKTVSGRKVVVRKAGNLASLERCHILFVGASEKASLAPALGAVQRWPVLTVGDFEGFAGRGGTIGFIRQENRVGFEINEESARKAGLKVNAKLLYLGKSVRSRDGGEK